MQRKSVEPAEPATVRRIASRNPRRTRTELARLDAAVQRPPDTSDIQEQRIGANRVIRDSSGRLPQKPQSPIRDAILAELERRGMNRQQLWKLARKSCPSLPETAIYEFLRGHRQIGVAHVDSLLLALDLAVAPAA